MPLTSDLMRDCILDALSQHVITFDRPSEMTISWAAMKRRTLDVALFRGLLTGVQHAFEPEDNKAFDTALWKLFQEGVLAPNFKTQRYGKNGWEESEFRLTARGMRGFASATAPTRDVPAFMAALRRAIDGLGCHEVVAAYAEQAARAAEGGLYGASAVMAGLAMEAALGELADACRAGEPAPSGVRALAAWLEDGAPTTGSAGEAIVAIAAAARGIPTARDGVGRLGACAPTRPEAEAGLTSLLQGLERVAAVVRAGQPQPSR